MSSAELHRYKPRLLPVRCWASPCYPWASVFPFVKWVSDSFHGFQRLLCSKKKMETGWGFFLKPNLFI